MQRIFFAIPLTQEIKDVLADVQNQMQDLPGRLKWVKPGSTHLTLKFVGEVEYGKPTEYADAIRELNLPEPFTITLGDTGVFPHPRKARVLWVGLQDSPELASMANDIDDRLEKEGVKPETREFHAHLTVARVKGRGLPGETLNTFLNLEIPDVSMEVDAVVCYESDLQPSGAVYSVLETIPLK
ncbi:MAG: RNA 2',3'-cyclic phosphodiesterase [Candidatus Marinimicrobia bacterium]|nr:RNA 2',3'-cyclic phosphodiesterase [Candidatus Neomarinimicrobiota bacterium]MCF7828077.1 RNA 2',3'-cyclic phosphodiesterase [Candidatus Neomarinimicrobiota bacterium]MCF7879748.1 RNA 2',3'-cyclic phosphodiesterase [Candidatus Neomarinimicrobiota bacterium]